MGKQFLELARRAFKDSNAAQIVAATTGSKSSVDGQVLLDDQTQFGVPAASASSVTIRGSELSTPRVSMVTAYGSSASFTAGDQIEVLFDAETNMPSSDSVERTVTRSDLDRLITFTPNLGATDTGDDYTA